MQKKEYMHRFVQSNISIKVFGKVTAFLHFPLQLQKKY